MTVAVRVIPCLDVNAGRVVKGVNFENLRDAGDPVELARRYDAEGADEITFLDVSASSEGRATTLEIVSRTAEQVFVPLTVGGGVRTVDDVDTLLRAGADKVGVNTAAIARPELIAEIADRFGAQVLVLSLDARRCPPGVHTESGYEVTTHGGRRSTGIDAVAWAVPSGGVRCGGDPPELHGRRRHHGRLRPRDARRRPFAGPCPAHRERRRGPGRGLRRRPRSRAPTPSSRRASSTTAR